MWVSSTGRDSFCLWHLLTNLSLVWRWGESRAKPCIPHLSHTDCSGLWALIWTSFYAQCKEWTKLDLKIRIWRNFRVLLQGSCLQPRPSSKALITAFSTDSDKLELMICQTLSEQLQVMMLHPTGTELSVFQLRVYYCWQNPVCAIALSSQVFQRHILQNFLSICHKTAVK